MIGIINSLLFDYIEGNYGTARLLALKEHLALPNDYQFRLDTYYADDEWQDVYAKTITFIGGDREQVEWDFGYFSGEALVKQFPTFVRGCTCARDLIIRQPKIHNAIGNSVTDPGKRKIINQKFTLEERTDQVVMHYVSYNKMCTFYRSLATWAGEHFGETVTIDEPRCMKRGDAECEIHLHYSPKGAQKQ
jgi:hypothetical protein